MVHSTRGVRVWFWLETWGASRIGGGGGGQCVGHEDLAYAPNSVFAASSSTHPFLIIRQWDAGTGLRVLVLWWFGQGGTPGKLFCEM
jgi:hypothetical protein